MNGNEIGIADGPTPTSARSRDWERRSVQGEDSLWVEARERWASLTPARQMDLARCLARCRQADYTRAYRQVVSVTAGLRRRNDEQGLEHLHNEPCLVFIVRRKLTSKQMERHPSQSLPREILTPAWIDGQEQVVAVPSDVQTQVRMLRARSQALTTIEVQGGGRWGRGSMTWAVSMGGKRYGIAPIHVLSPWPDLDGVGRRSGAEASLQQQDNLDINNPMTRSTAYGGRLVAGAAKSFDAQLADITQPAAFTALFGGLQLAPNRPWIQTEMELDALLADGRSLEIFAPADNGKRPKISTLPLQAVRSLVEQELSLGYDFADGKRRDIIHTVLELQVRFGDRTYPGDSGSPVLLRDANDQFSLVGMHIAGDGTKGTAYVVPVWRLMDPQSYASVGGSLPAGPIKLESRP